MKRRNLLLLAGGLIGTLVMSVLALRQDLEVSKYTLIMPDLPDGMNNLKILHLSDLHGRDVAGLLPLSRTLKPDLIAITGDFYDGVQHAETTDRILDELAAIAPVYLVGGNHEYYAGSWASRKEALEERSIHVVENRAVPFTKNGISIEIAGLRDPDLNWTWPAAKRLKVLKEDLQTLPPKHAFRLLLFHRADLFDETKEAGADVTFSGHLHGGHWRLFGKGVLAPSDGDRVHLFPRYDAGIFENEGGYLVVSRGLGDQMRVPRLFNRPQMILVTLKNR